MKNAHDKSTESLLARAALWRALARGFAYPEAGQACALAREFARLRAAPAAREFPPRLRRRLARAHRAWRHADDTACAAEYVRLFLGNGPVSLHETAYGDGRRIAGRPAELADINGFYNAFGFTLSAADPDLPDHLCAELEFYSLLLVKEAYARSRAWPAKARLARQAAKVFLEQHLGRWIEALESGLQEHRGAHYFDLAAAVAAGVAAECKRLRARPAPGAGRLPPDAMQDESFVCPQATGATAAP